MISSRQRKYALVTGASSGIGREYAAQLAAKGYDLVMAGNRNEENRAAAREIAARYGVRTLPLCMDLSEPDAAVKLHAETSARGIEIGVLVCNAGVLLVRWPQPRPNASAASSRSIARRPRCCAVSTGRRCGDGARGISS